IFQIKFFGGAFAREFPQASQRDLDVARTELDRIVEIAVFALVPHLHRGAVTRLVLPDAHAFRVVAISAKGRRTTRSNPLVAALVAAFLLVEALLQRLHQLLPAAEGLDLLLLLVGERQLDLLQQPLERDLRLDAGNRLHAVPELAEGAVELV